MGRALKRLRRAIREGKYFVSAHADEEMYEDNLEPEDVERIILRGRMRRKLTHDLRGTRFEVAGKALDGRKACVICRLLDDGCALVVTAYVMGGREE